MSSPSVHTAMHVSAAVSRRSRGTLSPAARATFEVLTLTALILPVSMLVHRWPQIAVIVPERFNADGTVLGTGLKSHLWFGPAIAAFVYVLLGVLSFFPDVYNLPVRPGHSLRPRLEHIAIEMILTMRLEFVTLFGLFTLADISSALTGREAYSNVFATGALAVIVLTLVLFIADIYRIARRSA